MIVALVLHQEVINIVFIMCIVIIPMFQVNLATYARVS